MSARARFGSFLIICLLAIPARAGTEVSLWHAYTPPSGEPHHAFLLSNYKRGIFFGSCGPSTHSLQWRYAFDLQGTGARFTPEAIEIKTEEGAVAFASVTGGVVIDDKKQTATITLQVIKDGATNNFVGNGTYRLREKL
jgi:hypothetical protein